MKKELTDKMLEFCVTINDVTPEIHYKWHASLLKADLFMKQQTCLKKSSSYERKHIKKLHNYKLSWKLHWEIVSSQTDSQWITFAVTYLKEGLRDFWDHQTKTSESWEDYIIWLWCQLTDPVNHMTYASLKLKNSQQHKE